MIENIDDYLKKNKKQFFAMMNSHWGKSDDDTKKLKFLWNKAQEANGVNNKIEAFEELKKAMAPFIHEDRLMKNEKILEDNNLDSFANPEDQLTLEMDRMFSTLSNFPEVNKLEDLNIDEVYSQHYTYDQMKKLAGDYGYDYRNKDDRIEFNNKLYNYHKAKNAENAFKTHDVGGLAVDFMLPVSKDYAKRNYDKIRTDSRWNFTKDMAVPLAADVASNVAMMGFPGKVTKGTAALALNNVTAPAIREGSQMVINDKPLTDAAIDFGGAVATNYGTPYLLNEGFTWLNRLTQPEAKTAARDVINQTANKVRDIERQLNKGKVFKRDNHDGSFTFAKKDRKGNIVNISNEEAAKATDIIPMEDYEFYINNRNIARTTPKKIRNQYVNDDAMMLGGKEKFNSNLQSGKPRFENMSPYEVADAANIKPKESIFNWAFNTEGANRLKDYITNFQGQTRFATPVINGITQATLGPLAEPLKIEKVKKLSESELMELDILQRLRDLHTKNPTFFSAPKIPQKYKEFFDDTEKSQWNSNATIRNIFGDE